MKAILVVNSIKIMFYVPENENNYRIIKINDYYDINVDKSLGFYKAGSDKSHQWLVKILETITHCKDRKEKVIRTRGNGSKFWTSNL